MLAESNFKSLCIYLLYIGLNDGHNHVNHPHILVIVQFQGQRVIQVPEASCREAKENGIKA